MMRSQLMGECWEGTLFLIYSLHWIGNFLGTKYDNINSIFHSEKFSAHIKMLKQTCEWNDFVIFHEDVACWA